MRRMLLCVAAALSGCVSTPLVDQASDEDSINTLALTCSDPYPLVHDCSAVLGATRNVVVNGKPIKVAGSADGKVILVMDPHLLANAMKDFFLLNSPTHSKANNTSVLALRAFLNSKGVVTERLRPVQSFGTIEGYVLELESDGYAHLTTVLTSP